MQPLVDDHAAVKLQPGSFQPPSFRPDADSSDHRVGRYQRPVLEQDAGAFDARYRCVAPQIDTFPPRHEALRDLRTEYLRGRPGPDLEAGHTAASGDCGGHDLLSDPARTDDNDPCAWHQPVSERSRIIDSPKE